jgi:hypothetical protein
MTERVRRFYLVAIWMPLIVPIFCAAGFSVQGEGSYEGIGADLGGILLLSLYSTGIPFTIFALWITHWLCAAGRTERQVRRLMWTSPLIVTAVAMPYWIVTFSIHDGVAGGLIDAVVFYLPYLIVIGYLYVLATAGARWILRATLRNSDERISAT